MYVTIHVDQSVTIFLNWLLEICFLIDPISILLYQ